MILGKVLAHRLEISRAGLLGVQLHRLVEGLRRFLGHRIALARHHHRFAQRRPEGCIARRQLHRTAISPRRVRMAPGVKIGPAEHLPAFRVIGVGAYPFLQAANDAFRVGLPRRCEGRRSRGLLLLRPVTPHIIAHRHDRQRRRPDQRHPSHAQLRRHVIPLEITNCSLAPPIQIDRVPKDLIRAP